MGDDSEWMKLPIDQKCEHKVGNLGFGLLCISACGDFVVLLYLNTPYLGNIDSYVV